MNHATAPDDTMPSESRDEIKRLLAAGGVTLPDEGQEPPSVFDLSSISKYAALSDPRGAERLSSLLADLVGTRSPNVIVVWEDAEDAVLGHIVARNLEQHAVRMWNADGLVACSGQFPERARAAIVTDVLRDWTTVRAMTTFVEQKGGTVVAVSSLISTVDDSAEHRALSLLTVPSGLEPKTRR